MRLRPVALEEVGLDELEPLLAEEVEKYQEWYRWDFAATARLVKQLVTTRSLAGVALLDGKQVAGYSYLVVDEAKGLVGDAFVREAWGTAENERLLMAMTVEELRRFPQIRRVESQPMMLRYVYTHPRADRYERRFMELDLREVKWPAGVKAPEGYVIEGWDWRREEETAQLLYRCYRGHVDAEINDQYRMPSKARAYLSGMLRYPSCGLFHGAASYTVSDKRDGRMVGVALSCVSEGSGGTVGHVSQLCVDPEARNAGLGRLLMLGALTRFCELGLEYSTLTVTAGNRGAEKLYASLGYQERTRLGAYIWPFWPV
jgi:ribosomal protein S18 acetylase RimI-like enzyme